MTQKKPISISMTQSLAEWAEDSAKEFGFRNRSRFVCGLLEAAREGRLIIRPRGPDAFPAETEKPGSTRNHPLKLATKPC